MDLMTDCHLGIEKEIKTYTRSRIETTGPAEGCYEVALSDHLNTFGVKPFGFGF